MAPELHRGQLFLKGKSSDMWALGCILLELLLMTPLWDLPEDLGTKSLEDPQYTREFIMNHAVLKLCDPQLISIMKRLLHPDPIQRMTVEELFKIKYVKKWLNRINHVKKSRMNLSTRLSSRMSNLNPSQEEESYDSSSGTPPPGAASFSYEGGTFSDY
jgi:serine/threonine protein kinase